MRNLISGMVAAVAVMAAAPAMACGYGSCSPCGYVSSCAAPVYSAPIVNYGVTYGGCGGCGWATERLPDPVQQYYYVNQGPTYTGPGNWAPRPVYEETGYGRPYYGYRRHYGYRYGYSRRAYVGTPYYHGRRVLRRYY
jgi:hypothetical protein